MCERVRVASWSAGGPGCPPVAASWRQAVQYLDARPLAEVALSCPSTCPPQSMLGGRLAWPGSGVFARSRGNLTGRVGLVSLLPRPTWLLLQSGD